MTLLSSWTYEVVFGSRLTYVDISSGGLFGRLFDGRTRVVWVDEYSLTIKSGVVYLTKQNVVVHSLSP